MSLIYGRDYACRYMDLPHSVKGFVLKDEEDFYTIYINARHSDKIQKETIKHELSHILRDDFLDEDCDKIENRY